MTAETPTVTVSQFGVCQGHPLNGGWRFTLTKPLTHLGIDRERLRTTDEQAIIRFDLSNTPPYTGGVEVGVDLPDGRSGEHIRAVTHTQQSLTVRLADDMVSEITNNTDREVFNRLGVRGDSASNMPTHPLIEVWAGEDAISFQPPAVKQIPYRERADIELYTLPKQMQRDFVAISMRGYSPAEWADERNIMRDASDENEAQPEKEYYIERIVEEAKTRLGIDGREAIDYSQFTGQKMRQGVFTPIQRVTPKETGTGNQRIHITKTLRAALPDHKHGDDCAIFFTETPQTDMVIGILLTGDGVPKGEGGDRVRKVSVNSKSQTHTVLVPESVFRQLSKGAADTADFYMMAGEEVIAIQHPEASIRQFSPKQTDSQR